MKPKKGHFLFRFLLMLVALIGFWDEAFSAACATSINITTTTTQNLCINATPTTLSATVITSGSGTNNATFTWYRNTVNSNSGGTVVQTLVANLNVSGNLVNTYVPVTTSVGTFYYYVTITNAHASCNLTPIASSQVVQVTVSAPSAPAGIDGTRCGTGTVDISATVNAGETIDWYSAATGGTLLLSNNTSFTTPSISTTTTYYAEARNTSNSPVGCVSATRTAVIASVYNTPVAPTAVPNSRCGTGTVNISATPGSGETIDWYAASTGGSPLQSGSANFTTPSISITTVYYAESRNPTCGAVSPTRTAVTATVNSNPTLTGVSQGPAVCSGANATINLTGLLPSVAQTIYYNINGGGTQAASVTSGAGGTGSFTVTVTTSNNGQPITVTSILVDATSCSSSFSNSINLSVNAPPAITSQPSTGNQSVCRDSPAIPISVTVTAGSGSVNTYQWFSNTVSSNSGGTLVATSNSSLLTNSYNPVTSSAGTLYYYCIITNSNSCSITSNVSGGVVVSNGSAPTITTQPVTGTQNICINNAATALTLVATGSNLTYQWYSSLNSDGSNPTLIVGATTASHTPATNVAGTLYYFCVVSSNSCSVNSSVCGPIIVYPASVAGSISGATAVCTGTNSTPLTLSGNTGTIQWQSSSDNSVFNDIGGATTSMYTATNLSATTYYRVVVTSGVCTSATSASVTVTVNTVSVSGSISGATTVCPGTNSTLLTLSGNTGTIQWQSSLDNSVFNNIGGATLSTYTALNLVVPTYYRVVVSNSPCASVNSNSVLVNVFTATSWTGNVDSDWSNPANWNCGIPSATFDADIPSGRPNYPIDPAAVDVKNLTLANGASLTLGAATILSVYGDWTNNNPGSSTFVSGSSEVIFAGSGSHTHNINGASNFNNLTVAADGDPIINVNGGTGISGLLTLNSTTTFNTGGNLTLLSTSVYDAGSIGVLTGATLTGDVTVERYMSALNATTYRYLSLPMTSALPPASWGSQIYEYQYNGSGVGNWYYHSPSSALTQGTGVTVLLDMNTPITWSATGTVAEGPVQWTFQYEGWYLIGNPFPSQIEWVGNLANPTAWTFDNISSTIGITDNSVASYPSYFRYWDYNSNFPTWGSGPIQNGVITMGQAFWIYVGAGGGSLIVNESAKNNISPGTFYRSAGVEITPPFQVMLSQGASFDVAYLEINSGASDKYEFNLDVVKLPNRGMNISIVSADQKKLAKQATSQLGDNPVPLEVEVIENGEYEISFKEIPHNLAEELYFIDLKAVSETRINEAAIRLNLIGGINKDRFYIGRKGDLRSLLDGNLANIFPNPARDKVNINVADVSRLTLLTATGSAIREAEINHNYLLDVSDLSPGVYFLRISNAAGTKVHKLIKK
jgi:hypothetical protein